VLSVFVGNIVDAAFAVGHQVQWGSDFRAGSIAHRPVAGSVEPCSCGRAGCLQATVSGLRLMQRAIAAGVIGRPRIHDLADAALAGDATAHALFRERAETVGRTLAPIVDLLSPDLVVVTDPALARLPDCLDRLRDQVAAHSYTITDPSRTVVTSTFSGDVLVAAAAAAFLDVLYGDPLGVVPLSRPIGVVL